MCASITASTLHPQMQSDDKRASANAASASAVAAVADALGANKPDPRDLVLTLCAMRATGQGPPALAGHTLVPVSPTKLMVFGGANDSSLSGDAFLCDVTTGKWEAAKPAGFSTPPPLFGHTAAVGADGQVFVFGGLTQSQFYTFGDADADATGADGDDADGDDPDAPPSPLSGDEADLDDVIRQQQQQAKAAAAAGSPAKAGASAVASSSSSDAKAAPQQQRRRRRRRAAYAGAVSAVRQRILNAVNRRPPELTNALYTFDHATTQWAQPPAAPAGSSSTAPAPRFLHGSCVADQYVFVFGGVGTAPHSGCLSGALNDVHLFDTEKNVWIQPNATGKAPAPRYGHTCTYIGNGQVLVFGGACDLTLAQAQKLVGAAPAPTTPTASSSASAAAADHKSSVALGVPLVVDIQPAGAAPKSPAALKLSDVKLSAPSGGAVDTGAPASTLPGRAPPPPTVFATTASPKPKQATGGAGPVADAADGTGAGAGRSAAAAQSMSVRWFNDLFLYDIKTHSWSQPLVHGTPPQARCFHTAALVGVPAAGTAAPVAAGAAAAVSAGSSSGQQSLVYIFAGETSHLYSDLCVLDWDARRWVRPLFDGSFEHELHAACAISARQILVYGGCSPNHGFLDDFFFVNTVSIRAQCTSNDHTFKLILAGNSEVGKSCLMTRFVEDRFSDIHVTTIGFDFKTVTTMIDGKLIKLHIWDTAGQERFAQVTASYYRGADGAILVYDMTNAKSYDDIEYWHENIVAANSAEHNQQMVRLVLANKFDAVAADPSARRVTAGQGMELARRLGAPFLEVSARDASNVDVAFLNLAKNLLAKRANAKAKTAAPKRAGMKLDAISSTDAAKPAGGCC